MRIKEGFKLRTLGTEYVVSFEGASQVDFNHLLALNSSAGYLWQSIADKEFTVDDLTDLLLTKYDIDRDTASADAAKLVDKLIEAGVVEA